MTGVAVRGTEIPHYDWSYYGLQDHQHESESFLNPHAKNFSPEMIYAINIKPKDITTLHAKAKACQNRIPCYELLWDILMEYPQFTPNIVKDEL